jgi:hypothetical protein
MAQQTFDSSSKWMVEAQGASILYLAGARNVVSCRARKAEVVQPRKLPDGLLEVKLAGRKKPLQVLVEIATYPEKRVVEQVQDDIRLVRQVEGELPEALVLCLCPRGAYRVPSSVEVGSALGWTAERLSWKVVEVWTLSVEELLAAPGVGHVPWATLARYEGPPEVLLRRCRERIDREGGTQRENLLAVSQVFARLHFDRPELLEILGGSEVVIESPLIQEILTESAQKTRVEDILHILQGKVGTPGPNIAAGLAQVKETEKLRQLLLFAATCQSLQAFEEELHKALPQPAPASTRSKRKPRKGSGQ